MLSIGTILLTFLLGVVTTVFTLGYLGWRLSTPVPMDPKERHFRDIKSDYLSSIKNGEPSGYRDLKGAQFFENSEIGLLASYSGWLTVTSEFYRFPQLASLESPPKPDNEDTTISGVTSIFKGRKGKAKEEEEDPAVKTSNQLNRIRRKHRFYAVLKHGNLFLYSDESKSNTKAVIVLSRFLISMWPRNLKESQLFTKRSAICLINKDNLTPLDMESILLKSDEYSPVPKGSHFLYSDTHDEKEDLYLVLLKALKKPDTTPSGTMDDLFDPTLFAKTLHFFTADMNDIQQTLNSTEGQLTTKWLNAMLGRIFLAIYHTPEFEASCIDFIETRLKKIRIPGFLDDLQIQRIETGHSAPFFTNPRLERLSTEGDLDVIFNFLYQGGCVIEISTKLFLNITGFKQREFDVILKITVKKIKGDILIHMKKQPSNRLWYGFTESPEMDLDIEPVFSSRALTYSIVTNMIRTKFREALNQSLVLPFMDNIAFYDTSDELFRAGIWNKKFRENLGNLKTDDQPNQSTPSVPPPLPTREENVASPSLSNDYDKVIDSIDSDVKESTATTGVSLKKTKSMRHTNSKSETDNISLEITENGSIKSKILGVSETILRNKALEETETIDSTSSQDSKIKQKVSNSYTMLRQWYNKKIPSSTPIEMEFANDQFPGSSPLDVDEPIYGAAHPIQTDPNSINSMKPSRRTSFVKNSNEVNKKGSNYIPPEMISNRRSKNSRSSVGSSNLASVIDSINADQSSPGNKSSPVTLDVPASPQMFVRNENHEILNSPVRNRHPSGSFNIYTATAEGGGILELGQNNQGIDLVTNDIGDDLPIRKSSDSLQALVLNSAHHELEKIPTTINEMANESDLEPSSLLKKGSQLKRKPPPLPARPQTIPEIAVEDHSNT